MEELGGSLATVLGVRHVTDLTRLSGGASRETFRFIADGRPLVLQRQRGGDTRNMGMEADVLRAVHAAGVPVPELVASSSDASELGAAYMISAAVDGETIARKILRDPEFVAARRNLPRQLGRALADLHRVDVSSVPGLATQDQVSMYRAVLDATGEPHPAFELAFKWLEAHRPTPCPPTLVHGDFRMGNIMVGPEGLNAVLDWELAHIGDPMEDLGWLCVKAWRFGSPHPVAGVGEYHQLLDAYAEASGTVVNPAVVRWWEVLGTLKWGIMCIGQATTHVSGAVRSHELAAIGRRVCENEHDLFLALEGRW
jgi:aminoglycoside phosphotransferase (APT) family kinase protein